MSDHPNDLERAHGEERSRGLNKRQLLAALGASSLASPILAAEEAQSAGIIRYPATLDRGCRAGGARLYDECGSQIEIFSAALLRANRLKKTLLVAYGAEWCIWCHVFDAYVEGKYSNFEYKFDGQQASLREYGDAALAKEANILHQYVAENFVIADIEGNYSRDGRKVLARSGALSHSDGGLPFIFTVTSQGRWAATFDSRQAETRREGQDWFRGYDRRSLLTQLKLMKAAATSG